MAIIDEKELEKLKNIYFIVSNEANKINDKETYTLFCGKYLALEDIKKISSEINEEKLEKILNDWFNHRNYPDPHLKKLTKAILKELKGE